MIGLAATLVVNGGWQAAAAGFATFNGVGFVLTFAVIGAAIDRPRPLHPSWTQTPPAPRRIEVQRAPGDPAETSERASAPARPGHRALPPERPRTA